MFLKWIVFTCKGTGWVTWLVWAVNEMMFGVEGKDERSENSNGLVFVLESCLVMLGVDFFWVVGGIGSAISESELLDEKVIRLRLGIDEEEEEAKWMEFKMNKYHINWYFSFSKMKIVQVIVYYFVVVQFVMNTVQWGELTF